MEDVYIWTMLNSLIILVITIVGKRWADGKLRKMESEFSKELEKIKSAHQKEQFIHKLQFEKEFEIYKELWGNLAELKSQFQLLIPILGNPNLPKVKPTEEVLAEMLKTHKKVLLTIERNKPFYDKKVYESASKVLYQATMQHLYYYNPMKDNKEKLDLAEKSISETDALIDDIEKTIHNRIGMMGEAKLVE